MKGSYLPRPEALEVHDDVLVVVRPAVVLRHDVGPCGAAVGEHVRDPDLHA